MESLLDSKVEIHESTRKDVASPATSPLLGFLLKFAKEEGRSYLDEIHGMRGDALWGIGQGAILCDDSSDDIPDESAQDETEFLNIINGPGLQAVPKGTSVS